MMLFKRANRTSAPHMRRERMSQNPWNLAYVQILDQSEYPARKAELTPRKIFLFFENDNSGAEVSN